MTRGLPTVAVVIPCYNQGAYLHEAVASVRAQTYARVELVVVDDGSDEPATLEALDALRASGTTVLAQPNAGLPAARNAGVRATNAPYFVPLDADDRLRPRFIERLIAPLETDERLGFVYGHVRLFGTRNQTWKCPAYERGRLVLHNLSVATALVRRASFDAAGGYSTDMTAGYEDWDLWLALASLGFAGRVVPEVLCEYRQHERGVSMRDRAERHHEAMTLRMIAHHRDLYRELLRIPATDPTEILAELQAAVELDHVRRARTWRWSHPLSAFDPGLAATPRAQLKIIQASRRYRAIRWLKRTPVWRWLRRGPA